MKSIPPTVEPSEVYEIDDILFVRLFGDYTLDVAMALQLRSNALAARYGYRLLLLDVQHLGTVAPAVRRFLAQDQRRERKDGAMAIVGANFAIRTLATMIVTGIAAFAKMTLALKFFETEELAQVWLEQERIRLRTAGGSTKLT